MFFTNLFILINLFLRDIVFLRNSHYNETSKHSKCLRVREDITMNNLKFCLFLTSQELDFSMFELVTLVAALWNYYTITVTIFECSFLTRFSKVSFTDIKRFFCLIISGMYLFDTIISLSWLFIKMTRIFVHNFYYLKLNSVPFCCHQQWTFSPVFFKSFSSV